MRPYDKIYLLEGVQLVWVLCTRHYSVKGNEAYLLFRFLTDTVCQLDVWPRCKREPTSDGLPEL